MPRLPVISGRELAAALGRLGFVEVSQRGSHLKMRRDGLSCVVPLHREVKLGTLAGVLKQAGVPLDDLLRAIGH